MGASLLVFSNKTDIVGCMTEEEIRDVRDYDCLTQKRDGLTMLGSGAWFNHNAQMDHYIL